MPEQSDDFIVIEKTSKFEILKKGKDYYIKALENSVDLSEVSTILVKHNIEITNFINIRNAITTKLREIVQFGTEKKKIVVTLSNDCMKAYATFYMTEEELMEKTKVKDDLEAIMKEKGIVFGIDLSRIFKQEKIPSNTSIIIAEGTPQEPGLDSVISLNNFNAECKPKELENGSVDHYEMGIIIKICEGDYIGEYTKPTDGIQGMTVTGNVVKANKGKASKISYDRKTIIEKDLGDKFCLYAKVSGCLKSDTKGQLFVANHLILDKVDFSTGNINFEGSVTINKTVEDGFSVIATDDIEIKGTDGIGCVKQIISKNGNVLLSGGINGRGKASIRGINVTSKYVTNANIFAENAVNVKNFILNSAIEAKEIIMENPSSQIAGGKVTNICKITTGNLGNESELDTIVELKEMNREKIEQKIVELTNRIEENKIKIIKLDKIVSDNMVEPDKIEGIIQAKSELERTNEELQKEFVTVQKLLSMKGEAEIRISKNLFPGVCITTGQDIRFVNKKMMSTIIYSKDGQIVLN